MSISPVIQVDDQKRIKAQCEAMRVNVVQNSLWRPVMPPVSQTCTCGQWMRHWVQYSGSQAAKSCGYDGCDEGPPYFAAHMENARNPDVIIPVCHLHHKREAAAGYVVMRAGTGVKAVPGPLC